MKSCRIPRKEYSRWDKMKTINLMFPVRMQGKPKQKKIRDVNTNLSYGTCLVNCKYPLF